MVYRAPAKTTQEDKSAKIVKVDKNTEKDTSQQNVTVLVYISFSIR